MYKLLGALHEFPDAKSAFGFGESVHLSVEKKQDNTEEKVIRFLNEKEFKNIEIRKIPAGIEDAFIEYLK